MIRKVVDFLNNHVTWITGVIVPVLTVALSAIVAYYTSSTATKRELDEKFAVGHVVADYIAYRFFHMFVETVKVSPTIEYVEGGRPKFIDCSKRDLYGQVIGDLRADISLLLRNPILAEKDELILTIAAIQNEIVNELPKKDHCGVSRDVVYHMCVLVPRMQERSFARQDVRTQQFRKRHYSFMKRLCGAVKVHTAVGALKSGDQHADRLIVERLKALSARRTQHEEILFKRVQDAKTLRERTTEGAGG